MKTKQLFLTALLTTSFFTAKAQNVQSDSLATSGGLNAGITTSTLGEILFMDIMLAQEVQEIAILI